MNKTEREMTIKEITEFEPGLQFGIWLAHKIRRKIMPIYGVKQKDVPINKISGDFNYAVDVLAEGEVKRLFEEIWEKGIYYGYVTEDQGLVLPASPAGRLPNEKCEWIFMIDPVDGSRPAQIGAENACVQIAVVKGDRKEATFKDIEYGITTAIKEDKTFVGQKGKGVYKVSNGKLVSVEKRKNITTELKDCSLVYETYSMSPTYTGIVIEPLIKETSFKTEYPSGSYSALTLVRGQNELHVDVRKRLIDDFPNLPVALKLVSKSLFPMDVAAGWLMIKELGGKVTDAYGNGLDDVRLWLFDRDGKWSKDNQISWVAAISSQLHKLGLEKIEEGFKRLAKKITFPS